MRLGNSIVSRVYLGAAQADRIYLGAQLVFQRQVPTGPKDTFSGAGSVDLLSYVGESGLTWTKRVPDAGSPATVTGGQLVSTEGPVALTSSRGPVLTPNQFAQAIFIRGAAVGSAMAIAVRMADAGHSYWFRFNGLSNLWQLFRTTPSEAATLIGSFSGAIAGWVSPGDTAVARIEADGTMIRALVNNTQIINVTDTNLTTGRAGVRPFRAVGSSAGQTITDFEAGSLVVEAAPTDIQFAPASVTESASPGTPAGTFTALTAAEPPPANITFTPASINENAPTGTTAGTFA